MLYNDFVLFRIDWCYSRLFLFHSHWRLISRDLPHLIDTNQFKNSLKRHNQRKKTIEPSHTGVTFHAVPHLCLNWSWEDCSVTSATHSENKIPFTDKNTVWAALLRCCPHTNIRPHHHSNVVGQRCDKTESLMIEIHEKNPFLFRCFALWIKRKHARLPTLNSMLRNRFVNKVLL